MLVLADAGLVPFLWITAPVGALLLGLTIVLVRGEMPLRPSLRWADIWPLLRDTLPYTAAVALNVVYFRVTILVMWVSATELETGYFATSFRVVEVLLTIPALVVGAAYPILARAAANDDARFVYAMRRILELSLLLGTWMAMCCAVGAQVAIDILAGDQAQPAVEVLRIQGLTLIATGLAVGAGYGLLTPAAVPRAAVDERARADREHRAHARARRAARGQGRGDRHARGRVGRRGRCAVRADPRAAGAGARAGGRAAHPACRRRGGGGRAPDRGAALVGLVIGNVVFVAGLVLVRRFPPPRSGTS